MTHLQAYTEKKFKEIKATARRTAEKKASLSDARDDEPFVKTDWV